jgi:hypothetical protein
VRLGMHLREVWQHKIALVTVLVVALLVGARVYGFGLLPPSGLKAAEGEATARVLVDTPQSTAVDLRQSTYNLEELNNRAKLVGNAIGTAEVRELIAAKVGVSPSELAIETPLITEYAELEGVRSEPTNPYRLDVQADPTVPVIDVVGAAPTEEEAAALVDATTSSLVAYVAELPTHAERKDGKGGKVLRLVPRPLGEVESHPLQQPGRALSAVLAFLVILLIGSASIVFVSRQRREYRRASQAMRSGGAG